MWFLFLPILKKHSKTQTRWGIVLAELNGKILRPIANVNYKNG